MSLYIAGFLLEYLLGYAAVLAVGDGKHIGGCIAGRVQSLDRVTVLPVCEVQLYGKAAVRVLCRLRAVNRKNRIRVCFSGHHDMTVLRHCAV